MRVIILALITVLFVDVSAYAQPGRGRGLGPERGLGNNGSAESVLGIGFDIGTEQIIRSYFRDNSLPPVGLPPGIAKNYARGKPLPPGIAKRYLPADLRPRLPAYQGYELVVVDRDVLLVAIATGIIVDILVDAL